MAHPQARQVAALALALYACGERAAKAPPPAALPGTTVRMEPAAGFWAAPFPSEARRDPAGGVDLSGFPGAGRDLRDAIVAAARTSSGFGITSTIYFPMTGPLDPARLPSLDGSVAADAPVFVLRADGGPGTGVRHPVRVRFDAEGSPTGTRDLLTLLPLQGRPLEAGALYAAAVRRSLGDAAGRPLGRSEAMAGLLAGGGTADERQALAALAAAGVPPDDLAGLTVFRTWEPTAEVGRVLAHALERPLPAPGGFERREVFEAYCVYAGVIDMPVYQTGTPPYDDGGGAWTFDAAGAPLLQRHEAANFVVTVPRRPVPAAGFPTVLMSRTGAGGDRPLVDRGAHGPGGALLVAGSGPAQTFAEAGFAGASIDGPHGGRRNVTGRDEQLLIFNILNPVAMRDNIRQSALELALAAHVLAALELDASDCPGVGGPVRLDGDRLALMGHSMGATIAPLALNAEPRFRAAILSGAGGSWIENVMWKQKPLEIRPFAEALVGYELEEHDPLLALLQWAGEPADPPVYAYPLMRSRPLHVLVLQGIVDHYILPPIANACSLSFGLDLGGEPLDAAAPELAVFDPLERVLGHAGRARVALPASGNREGATALVVQHAEDGLEDGHEVMFQRGAPKHQYRCFLESFARGTPVVPAAADEGGPCP